MLNASHSANRCARALAPILLFTKKCKKKICTIVKMAHARGTLRVQFHIENWINWVNCSHIVSYVCALCRAKYLRSRKKIWNRAKTSNRVVERCQKTLARGIRFCLPKNKCEIQSRCIGRLIQSNAKFWQNPCRNQPAKLFDDASTTLKPKHSFKFAYPLGCRNKFTICSLIFSFNEF